MQVFNLYVYYPLNPNGVCQRVTRNADTLEEAMAIYTERYGNNINLELTKRKLMEGLLS